MRLQQVSKHVFPPGARGALLAFADYNADNYVDLFVAVPPASAAVQPDSFADDDALIDDDACCLGPANEHSAGKHNGC